MIAQMVSFGTWGGRRTKVLGVDGEIEWRGLCSISNKLPAVV